MVRMTEGALLWFLSSSNVSLAQAKTWPALAVYALSPCLTQSSPSMIWQIMSFFIASSGNPEPGAKT